MSKRNFILLIIILVIVAAGSFVFLYFRQGTIPPLDNNGQGTNFISQFNPFGNMTPTPPKPTPPADISGYQPDLTPEVKLKLIKVSSMPVAGFAVFPKERLKDVPLVPPATTPPTDTQTPPPSTKTTKPIPPPTEFMPFLRYVDRANGNIYQTFADKIAERKFSQTVIPKIYEAFFGNKGESVIMRYLKADGKTIETFVGNLPKELLGTESTGTNEIKGTFLPEDIKNISISPDTGSVFYLFNVADNIVGTTLNLTTNKKVQIFDSPFTEWLSEWPNSKIITFTTKPSSSVPGYMYKIDPSTSSKNLNQVFGNVNGLTTLTSPDGKLVLYGSNNLSLNIYHTDTKATELLGVKTLPEKCVWGKVSDIAYCAVPKLINSGSYPDAWYQGEVSFSDQIWKIDIKNGNASIIADPVTISAEEVDGIKLALDEGENYLFFVNKKDSFLWKLELK